MDRKSIIVLLLLTVGIITSVVTLNAWSNKDYEFTNDYSYNISPSSNFFTQVEKEELVSITPLPEDYVKASETDDLVLYVKEEYLAIAVEVKETGYIWYSEYQNVEDYNYTDSLEQYVKSGVSIEYFNKDSLNDSKTSILEEEATLTYDYYDGGFKTVIDFESIGIKFAIKVTIEGDKLHTKVLSDSIVETEFKIKSKKTPINNGLKSVELFPFFGSENYEIDGYSFIPDGSGALIRYDNIPQTTAFRSRVYGDDAGYKNSYTIYDHLQTDNKVTLPVYGVVHGVNQNAFFTEVLSGDSKSELYSYPYQYLTDFNTTFMKYIFREKYTVRMSGGTDDSIAVIDENPSQEDVLTSYTFLSGDQANYVGMANYYKQEFDFKHETTSGDIPLRLEFIGLEYKKGLFGKNYQVMTSYSDVVNILKDLESSGITSSTVVYESFNKNGFYDNAPVDPNTSRKLGGKDDFESLVSYIEETNNTLSLYNDSYRSFDSSFNSDLANQVTLNLFEMESDSNLFDYEYLRKPDLLADPFVDELDGYQKLEVVNVSIDTVGSMVFSYRENQQYISRESAKATIISEVASISESFNISLYEPNSYLLSETEGYYDAPYESSRYPFMTDSVPFLSILLSGHVELYSEYANFISDYYIYALRMVEYGINPSFILTEKETYLLRYTNSEYVYTSEYKLWESHIKEIYEVVNNALKHVHGEAITDFYYQQEGLSVTTYENGVSIIVNYNEEAVTYDTHTVESMSYIVVNGGDLLE